MKTEIIKIKSNSKLTNYNSNNKNKSKITIIYSP